MLGDTHTVDSEAGWDEAWDWEPLAVDGVARHRLTGAGLGLVVALMLGGATLSAFAVMDGMGMVIDVASAIGDLLPGD